jgi:hypothetical protein
MKEFAAENEASPKLGFWQGFSRDPKDSTELNAK